MFNHNLNNTNVHCALPKAKLEIWFVIVEDETVV